MSNISRWVPVIAGAVAGGVIALIIAGSSGGSSSVTTTVTTQAQPSALPTSFAKTGSGMSINQIYRSASPGVVDIVVTSQGQGQGFGGLFGGGGSQKTQGEGAGVVYNANGDILTDEHVVAGATSVKVNFQDHKSYPATVVGTDPSTDVAVVHVSAPSSELHPIPLAESTQAQVGDPVVAIGSPFSLPETTTQGIVSQTGRSIQAPNGYTIPNAVQTDAAINPGNSGGPLLDANGHVLGLNDQIETNNQNATGQGSSSGVGFAIPSDTVKRIAGLLIRDHGVKHAYVGVELVSNSPGGAGVASVKAGTPAAAAGLQAHDVITAVNGQKIVSTDQFIALVDTFSPGRTVTMTVTRDGHSKQVTVKLGTRPTATTSGG